MSYGTAKNKSRKVRMFVYGRISSSITKLSKLYCHVKARKQKNYNKVFTKMF